MKSKNYHSIDYYINLPWTYTVEIEEYKNELYYILRVNELPGVCTDSTDLNEAMHEIKDAIAGSIELYISQGRSIPEPIDPSHYKGKISYRTDSHRHYELVRLAKRQHKSLNKTLDMVVDAGMQQIGI